MPRCPEARPAKFDDYRQRDRQQHVQPTDGFFCIPRTATFASVRRFPKREAKAKTANCFTANVTPPGKLRPAADNVDSYNHCGPELRGRADEQARCYCSSYAPTSTTRSVPERRRRELSDCHCSSA